MRRDLRLAIGLLTALVLGLSACTGDDPPAPDDDRPLPEASVEWSSIDAEMDVTSLEVNDELVAVAGEGPDGPGIYVYERGETTPRWSVPGDVEATNAVDRDTVTLADSAESPVVVKGGSHDVPREVVRGLAAADGTTVWEWAPETAGPAYVDVLGTTGELVVLLVDDAAKGVLVTALRLDDGRVGWQQRLKDVDVRNEAILQGERVLLGDRVLDAASGEVLWQATQPGLTLAISGDTLLWLESEGVARLIDVTDPSAEPPALPTGAAHSWTDPEADLVVYSAHDDSPEEIVTFVDGESDVVRFDTEAVDVVTGKWSEGRVFVVEGDELQVWDRTGQEIGGATLPMNVDSVLAAGAGTVTLEYLSNWYVVGQPE